MNSQIDSADEMSVIYDVNSEPEVICTVISFNYAIVE